MTPVMCFYDRLLTVDCLKRCNVLLEAVMAVRGAVILFMTVNLP